MIRVLFLVRPDLFKIRAGDTIQITSLKRSLEKLGAVIELKDSLEDSSGYDLCHVFNILRVDVALTQCRQVKEANYPLIVTPIYWNLERYLHKYRPERLEWWRQTQQRRAELLTLVDLLAPNAWSEWELMKIDFELDLPCQVIYNGVDPFFFQAEDGLQNRDGIICVGRIHSRKNQLQLIRALQGTGLKILLVGEVNDPNYYRLCLQDGGEMVRVIKGVDQKKLNKIYQQARVHVLASWYDTPGLVNLEAGLAGCNLVTTSRGTAREYLGERAFYCDPEDQDDIRKKVLIAYNTPPGDTLARHILAKYTWDRIAEETLIIYHHLLSEK